MSIHLLSIISASIMQQVKPMLNHCTHNYYYAYDTWIT